jgi:hypothetical protein
MIAVSVRNVATSGRFCAQPAIMAVVRLPLVGWAELPGSFGS